VLRVGRARAGRSYAAAGVEPVAIMVTHSHPRPLVSKPGLNAVAREEPCCIGLESRKVYPGSKASRRYSSRYGRVLS
jgi:hypothetical protein